MPTKRLVAKNDKNTVWLVTGPRGGEFIVENVGDDLQVRLKELKAEWDRVASQVTTLIDGTPATAGGFALTSVEVSLGLKASGKIGFIAEVSGEASATFKVTFTRRP
jgi:hypothetical protein